MAVTRKAEASASAMGARAGETFRDIGAPSPNPFDQDRRPALAEAWRRAYFAALTRRV